jgi:ABC-2 type transport system ATP-binding protein
MQAEDTILLTTHNMEEADALCQRLAIIDHGRIIAKGSPQELKASVPGGFVLRLRFGRQSADLLQRFETTDRCSRVRT